MMLLAQPFQPFLRHGSLVVTRLRTAEKKLFGRYGFACSPSGDPFAKTAVMASMKRPPSKASAAAADSKAAKKARKDVAVPARPENTIWYGINNL